LKVLFATCETRVADFLAYSMTRAEGKWSCADAVLRNQRICPRLDCPVVNVSWEEANKFCEWLTSSERNGTNGNRNHRYRLPTDDEWSIAVGLGGEIGATAAQKSGRLPDYPWGKDWPPPNGCENYSDSTAQKLFGNVALIPNYQDGFAVTSPVGSFAPNHYGLYDMGGNVYEWCADPYDPPAGNTHVKRGASWARCSRDELKSSFRSNGDQADLQTGFRCVLEIEERSARR
jgi:formylglycine-generating enzyme required for sulfatase activity